MDIFDNLLLLKEEPGWALFEPIPIRKTERPPVIVDKVKPGETNATVYIHDIYAGPGLRGVPRGEAKALRIFQYEFSYRNQGGHYFVGMEGGWDVRRLIGTVPLEADGSAQFHIPANTPIAIQPLDREGKALQQMRSWMVGMPGEYVSCVGCHEPQNSHHRVAGRPRRPQKRRRTPPLARRENGASDLSRKSNRCWTNSASAVTTGRKTGRTWPTPTIIPTSGGISPLPRSYPRAPIPMSAATARRATTIR